MTPFTLIHANLTFKPLTTLFNILLLGFGITTILTLSQLDHQIHERMTRDLKGIDLVVSGKGSPLQIILSTVFHLDIPTGNIPVAEVESLSKNSLVKAAIPLALGDNYQGFRIIGTTSAYTTHYGAKLADGHTPEKPMQVALGAETARITGVKVGDKIIGAHGLVNSDDLHTDMPYTVVGILKPTGTVIDRVVITPIESVWHVHEHPDEDDAEEIAHKHDHPEQEITALLISYKSPLAAAQLPRMINSNTSMQAASPAFEVARLTKLMGTGSELLSVFGVLLMTFSAFGFFVTLSNAINERMRDIALIRSLGAPRMRVTNLILGEALVLGIAGIVAGIVLTYVLQTGVRITVENIHHITLPPAVLGDTELITIGAALALSIVSAIVPACRAYRLRITEILTRS